MPYIYRTVKAGMVKKPPTGQGGRLCWKKIQVDPEFSHKRVCVKVENKKEHKEMYNPFIQVEIKDGELEQIMEELSQATPRRRTARAFPRERSSIPHRPLPAHSPGCSPG